MWRTGILVLAVVVASCRGVVEGEGPGRAAGRSPGPATVEEPRRYQATALVLESEDHGPMLCLGGVATSLPPQCGDVPIANWDWKAVEGERSLSGTSWGEYHVVGTYDGDSFTVMDAGPPEAHPAPFEDDPIDTPCPEPAGGWVAPDPTKASDADRQAAARAAEAEPDFSGLWIDYADETPTEEEAAAAVPGYVILNVAFTGDVERHTAELREVWGGPLCVVQHERTYDELRDVQKDLERSADDLGIQILWSDTSVTENVVEVGVVAIDPASRQAIEERYGVGAARVFPALMPVD